MADVRRAEVLAALAVAADAGMGHPSDLALRSAVLAAALAKELGATAEERSDAWNLALLRFAGCTSESHLAAAAFGDEVRARAWLATADFGRPTDVVKHAILHHAAGSPALTRAKAIARALMRASSLFDAATAHCEVAQLIAARLGFGARMKSMLGQVFERWDGKGSPHHARKGAVALPVRIACLAHDVELFHRAGGHAAALDVAKARRGGAHEPALVDSFVRNADALLALLERDSPWEEALAAEPLPHARLEGEALDRALEALADFGDLKSRFTRGHSKGVARLMERAASGLGLDAESARHAGYLHDLGRAAVSVSIWDKPAALTATEREQVRLHTYFTERALARAGSLGLAAEAASLAHERLDASGYHRALTKGALTTMARLLAAADVYQAMTEVRAHRPAHRPEEAAAQLRRDADAGKLCPEAVAAVLKVAGHAVAVVAAKGGLSERELEVLRLLSRGQTNKEIAAALGISPKTAGHHVQHIYDKLGVSTRAAATFWAMNEGVV